VKWQIISGEDLDETQAATASFTFLTRLTVARTFAAGTESAGDTKDAESAG